MNDKFDRFGLGYRPDIKQMRKEVEKRQERRKARLSGVKVKWESMAFPHISKTLVSEGFIYPERRMLKEESIEEMMGDVDINAIDTIERETLLEILPYKPGSELNNWTAEEIPTLVSEGFIYPERRMLKEESIEEMMGDVDINAIDTIERETLLEILPYKPGSELNNWTAEEIPVVFRACSE
ncbi:hypothetical protein GOBAR_DD17072 [Gossypium barbadense]|nr:hypothetical protein GOBAR_DD17072 [Gossypium barbadense]